MVKLNGNTILRRKTIFDLLGESFLIPSYQRGYRWRSEHVQTLLDHILEFAQKPCTDPEFYCLQPVVVVKKENKYEVIDGQQRLTTLRLIIKYLMKSLNIELLKDEYLKDLFTLSYQTRPDSEEFWGSFNTDTELDDIDIYHIKNAYKTIEEWAANKHQTREERDHLLGVLLGKETDNKSIQIIWYEISENDETTSPYDLFSRLNIGKISLSNAELIKALFLRSWNDDDSKPFKLRQIKIASEWDYIENRLQDNGFWYFIHNSNHSYVNRIEYIFDIIKDNLSDNNDKMPRHTFNQFYDEVYNDTKREDKIDQCWQNIKNYFYYFDGWYKDNETYNLIGFIITTKLEKIDLLIKLYQENEKNQFKEKLKNIILKQYKKIEIDELQYSEKKYGNDIRFTLLLHNIITIIKSNNYRLKFPFDLYKLEKWDIEHINPQTATEPIQQNSYKIWLEIFKNFYDATPQSEMKEEISLLLSNENIDNTKFKELFEKIEKDINPKDGNANIRFIGDDNDSIGNLTLLDDKTNRSYKNAWFPLKRQRILQDEATGKFVPIVTKNIFTKAYSSPLSNAMKWDAGDIACYESNIKETIDTYLGVKND